MSGPVRGAARGPSQRQLRVGEELRHVLAAILERGVLRDPDLQGRSITVSEVRVSADLTVAKVFVTPLGGKDGPLVVKALTRSAPALRRLVAQQVRLRVAPSLAFALDQSFAEAEHIARLLHRPEVARDLVARKDGESPDDG